MKFKHAEQWLTKRLPTCLSFVQPGCMTGRILIAFLGKTNSVSGGVAHNLDPHLPLWTVTPLRQDAELSMIRSAIKVFELCTKGLPLDTFSLRSPLLSSRFK